MGFWDWLKRMFSGPPPIDPPMNRLERRTRAAIARKSKKHQNLHPKCHCGRALDTVGRCEYHGLPK